MDVENSITRDLWLPTLGIFIVLASRSEVPGRVFHFRIEGTSSIKILPENTDAFHRIRGLRSMLSFLSFKLVRFQVSPATFLSFGGSRVVRFTVKMAKYRKPVERSNKRESVLEWPTLLHASGIKIAQTMFYSV